MTRRENSYPLYSLRFIKQFQFSYYSEIAVTTVTRHGSQFTRSDKVLPVPHQMPAMGDDVLQICRRGRSTMCFKEQRGQDAAVQK